jgi:hypothetical protein
MPICCTVSSFCPAAGDAAKLFGTALLGRPLAYALNRGESERVKLLRRGTNVQPPAVAVLYDGWVTKSGSVLTTDVFIPTWPDNGNITAFHSDHIHPVHALCVRACDQN